MLSRVSENIAYKFVQRKIIKFDDLEIYQYGINMLLTGIIDFISILFIGILWGSLIECICFVTMFIPLRQYAGGYHASTPKKCYISTLLMIFIVLSAIDNIHLDIYILWGLLGAFGAVFLILSPVEAVNKPLDDVEKRIYKKKAIVIWCVELCAAVICTFVGIERLFECTVMAHAVIAVTLILGKIQGYRNKMLNCFGKQRKR